MTRARCLAGVVGAFAMDQDLLKGATRLRLALVFSLGPKHKEPPHDAWRRLLLMDLRTMLQPLK
jgi:hypothetical protein